MNQTTQKKLRKLSSRSDAGIERAASFDAAQTSQTTIVEYTDRKQPQNAYPDRIVSPPRSGACCFTDMEELGAPRQEGRWVYQYRRCRKCGFALRVILREIPDEALAAELRRTLANSFVRNVPD